MSQNDQLFQRFGKAVPVGEVLFREGEPGDTMYVIQSGRVRITKRVHDEVKNLAELGPGEFFGEMAILNQKARAGTAEVIEDARLLVIDRKKLESMIAGNTEIAVRLIQKLARRLDSANALIEILMHRDPKARVILGLSREAESVGVAQADGSTLVRLDVAGLARQVGLAATETEQVVARLKRVGVVETNAEGFVVRDLARLSEFLDFLEMRERYGDA